MKKAEKKINKKDAPLPILHLANALKPYGISTGEVKKDQEFDGFYIPNAPQSPHFFQMIYNLDPNWGQIGFQIFSEDGKDDIYFGDDAVVALKAIVKYLESIKNIVAKDYQFIGVVKGPVAYLGEFGCTAEHIILTKEEIEEELEDGETPEDYIDYYLEEYVNEWEQKFCSAQVYTKEQWEFLHFIIEPNK